MDERIKKVISNLQRNNMAGYFVENREELLKLLAALMKKGETVGCGDSVTLEETGVLDLVRNGDFIFYDKHQPGLTPDEKRAIYLQNFNADTFLTGANAITLDGKLFNIDGNGSRVAPMLYGPKQVIVVAGINKLTDTVEDPSTAPGRLPHLWMRKGFTRIRHVQSWANASIAGMSSGFAMTLFLLRDNS